jgi:cation transport ATPase
MNFCPKCGTDLKAAKPTVEVPAPAAPAAPAPAPVTYRAEKAERGEKQEKQEKGEKQEKHGMEEKGERREMRQLSYVGPLIGGLFLVLIGFFFYLALIGTVQLQSFWALFLVLIGIVIIGGAIYAAMTASRRHPPT